ncbi:MAG TPA: DegT/DnrJ/EryC1/StrS family aminotransferase [Polyangiaceae bacterium]|nr:DegT/DnrJ/EryC1/StrS family aminotransferase [Polyangiaceae bacterium]
MALPASLLGPQGPLQLVDKSAHTLWPVLDDECRAAVLRVLDRGVLSGSFAPESMAFQEEFADFVGAKHALLTHSGTSALVVALAAAGVGPGDEVIVPAYTFVATPLAVVACGGVPVFADVDAATGNVTVETARRWLSPRTKAFMPVHVHGNPFDIDELVALASSVGAVVVEDAAQAHGATYKGKKVGALATGGGFSLQSSKNLGAGEGGVYVTNDYDRAELANQIRNFGQDLHLNEAGKFDPARPLDGWRSMESLRPGSMYRGNELMAAVARALLKRLPERTAQAQENAERLSARLRALPGVLPPETRDDRRSVHHKYRVRIDRKAAGLDDFDGPRVRAALVAALKATGFETTLWERTTQTAQSVFAKANDVSDNVRENYHAKFPNTQALLDDSFLLFTQSCPLIAQSRAVVDAYADGFEKLWAQRRAIVENYEG